MKKLDKIQSVSITVACICLVVTILMSFLYLSKTNELDDVKAQLKSVQLTSETSGNHTDIEETTSTTAQSEQVKQLTEDNAALRQEINTYKGQNDQVISDFTAFLKTLYNRDTYPAREAPQKTLDAYEAVRHYCKSSAYGKITENAVYLKDDGINVGALDETGETTFAARIDHVRCYVQSLDDGSCNLLAVYEYKVSTNPDKDTETHTSTHTKMYHCRMELNSSGTMWQIAEQYFDTAVTGDLAYDVADYLTGDGIDND